MALVGAPFTFERFMAACTTIRPLTGADLPSLAAMLYEAASVEPAVRALGPAHALALPFLARHLRDWGRGGDDGVIALGADGTPLGAAWYRLYPVAERGRGVLAWPGVPEVTLGVRADQRGRGLGGAFLTGLKVLARKRGYRRLVVCPERGTASARFYRRHGFDDVAAGDGSPSGGRVMAAEID